MTPAFPHKCTIFLNYKSERLPDLVGHAVMAHFSECSQQCIQHLSSQTRRLTDFPSTYVTHRPQEVYIV